MAHTTARRDAVLQVEVGTQRDVKITRVRVLNRWNDKCTSCRNRIKDNELLIRDSKNNVVFRYTFTDVKQEYDVPVPQ